MLTISVTPPGAAESAAASLNGSPIALTGTRLKSDSSYALMVTAPGYKPFSTTFSPNPGSSVVVPATMLPEASLCISFDKKPGMTASLEITEAGRVFLRREFARDDVPVNKDLEIPIRRGSFVFTVRWRAGAAFTNAGTVHAGDKVYIYPDEPSFKIKPSSSQ